MIADMPRSGLAWNDQGTLLASGGNDNTICIFDARHSLDTPVWQGEHASAVKALAFCPWIEGVLASGGGTHDQKLCFWQCKPVSGTQRDALPVKLRPFTSLEVRAQVTGIVWSRQYRELCVTYGYTASNARRGAEDHTTTQHQQHPGSRPHAAKICLYTWPDLKCIAAIGLESSHPRVVHSLSTARVAVLREVMVRNPVTDKLCIKLEPHVVDGEDVVLATSDQLVRICKSLPSSPFLALSPCPVD